MAGFKALGQGAKAGIVAAGAALVVLAGYGVYSTGTQSVVATLPDDGLKTAPLTLPEPAPTAVAAPSPPPAISPKPAEPAPKASAQTQPDLAPMAPNPDIAIVAPSFDVVRVEPDGTAVVAGRADPNAKVILRVGGAEVMSTTADSNGNFAAFFVLESSDTPRMLTMGSILPNQPEVPAAAEVALAPTKAPVVVAAAKAQPAPEPATPNPPAALLVTEDGVKVLQSGDQPVSGPTADLTIDTISYTPGGDVQLAGRGGAGGTLRIYLDNAPLVDASVAADGAWTLTLPPVAPGLYTLRVDQLAADGNVTARFETPFKRETAAALAAAAQPVPAPAQSAEDAVVAVAAPEPEPAPSAEAAIPTAQAPAAAATNAVSATDIVAADAVAATAQANAAQISTATPAAISITVQPGFTLWGIASKQFGDGVMYVQVFEANKDKIRDPNLIYPGQVFVIPTASE